MTTHSSLGLTAHMFSDIASTVPLRLTLQVSTVATPVASLIKTVSTCPWPDPVVRLVHFF